jgi:hypothetical protein
VAESAGATISETSPASDPKAAWISGDACKIEARGLPQLINRNRDIVRRVMGQKEAEKEEFKGDLINVRESQ